jgi:tRNA-splicing ligase RtcB
MKLASGTDKPKEGHYGFLPDSPGGQDYINDMEWMLTFARLNRLAMIEAVDAVVQRHVGDGCAYMPELINRNHNHAEERDGLWIHRKGATHAEKGMRGVVPGNMRDGSFIVVGKGNPKALWSSAHGAGRALGRGQAKRTLSMDEFKATMEGVVAKVDTGTLDESPMAYKDIFEVMRLQGDLVDVLHHVRPILNVKA